VVLRWPLRPAIAILTALSKDTVHRADGAEILPLLQQLVIDLRRGLITVFVAV
jgi:hypothetical protein